MDISYNITPDLAHALKKLDHEIVEAYTLLKGCEASERESMHKYVRVSMIGASTRIENAQLTDAEINWIDTILTQDGQQTAFKKHKNMMRDKLSKDRERSLEEVAGCRDMLLFIYQNAEECFPLKEADLRALHYQLMNHYPAAQHYAGSYKVQSNSVIEYSSITKKERVIFETAPAGPVTKAAMHDLVMWYNEILPIHPWPIAVTCEFVYRFLSIHPFQDGNGRLGRGLFLLSLLNAQSPALSYVSKYIAIDRYIEKYKQEYYLTLNRCSAGKYEDDPSHYHIDFFLKFMIKVMREALANIHVLQQRFLAEQSLSVAASKILACFKEHPEVRLTSKLIVQQTELPVRTINYALKALLDKKIIQRYGQGAGTRYQLIF